MNEKMWRVLENLRGELSWRYVGESRRVTYRPGSDRWTASRGALIQLRLLGLIEVRTVTVDNWECDPPIEDRQGSWVEARLSGAGQDAVDARH